MKKILVYLLIGILAFSMLIGCKKKDETEELDLGQAVKEGEIETEEASNGEDTEEIDEVEYILYLRYKDEHFLYDELFSVNIDDEKFKDRSIEEFVLQQLIDYEEEGTFISPVPEGVKVLSITREGDNVIINLSKEFKEKKMSSSDAMLTIGGIVNSIVALPGNETAQIMVEGEALESFNGVDTSEPFYFLEGLFPDK